ncbi:MAG: arsenate reductase ArsC [candidate division WOR-3 bacterium]|nr:arsenate reductase ArsC [candidate division WOR-3 bacterium]
MNKKIKILFLCEENSCRSQIAEGIVNNLYSHCCQAKSAGSRITEIDPKAILIMKEINIDISQQRSKLVDEFFNQEFDYVITLCGQDAKNNCPYFVGKVKERLFWDIPNPKLAKGEEKEILNFYREIRELLKEKIDELCKKLKGENNE